MTTINTINLIDATGARRLQRRYNVSDLVAKHYVLVLRTDERIKKAACDDKSKIRIEAPVSTDEFQSTYDLRREMTLIFEAFGFNVEIDSTPDAWGRIYMIISWSG